MRAGHELDRVLMHEIDRGRERAFERENEHGRALELESVREREMSASSIAISSMNLIDSACVCLSM